MREIILAKYDNMSHNPNVMRLAQAEKYGDAYLEEKLVSRVRMVDAAFHGYVSSEVVQVKEVRVQACTAIPTQGRVIAICEPVKVQHRRLKKSEMAS